MLTTPMTDARGTSSPPLYHHFASHMWQVVKERSFSPAFIAIVMRSPARHSGQLRLGVCCITVQSSALWAARDIAQRVHFQRDTPRLCRWGELPTPVPLMGRAPGDGSGGWSPDPPA